MNQLILAIVRDVHLLHSWYMQARIFYLSLKKHSGWKSSTVAEEYVEDSIPNKINVSSILTGKILQGSNGKDNSFNNISSLNTKTKHLSLASTSTAGININN